MRESSRGAVRRLVLGATFGIAAATLAGVALPAAACAQATGKTLGIDTTNFDR